ncbi:MULTISPECIES: heme-binding domain-containing protein [Roseivirga]|uniref:Haem-binding domain-containing protein n=1 Tax=Roseivirga spongicola TaxID=333140 RepID=A0A150X1N3_9BACT|nr:MULTISPECIES: heme-binding domain-containing protein [Roseivirga]KYG72637.1 hypothetical protein AWW68_17200 [Roseivirga spongicola]MBO6659364.1 heme-binding domain-containing protein [Roseivirga sp.]MBO6760701.1 heme-binding domain-containing protein [Roseivirga sp.]MBO6907899.1 heme-binding domain-containing protein [Roseivirga sp.]WPZ10237.1 heme-binding domain-containing protein [Roseivirga spongicola]
MIKVLKYILLLLFIGLVIIQFINKPERISEPVSENDMIESLQVNADVAGLLKAACYDCHSNQPRYPWYASIAPVSWSIAEHIEHGRSELNFSEWATYSARKRDHKLEEMVEEVEVGNMPMPGYVALHKDANLSADQFEMLKAWVEQERTKIAQESN